MKRIRKPFWAVLSLALVAAMLFGLVACGPKAPPAGSEIDGGQVVDKTKTQINVFCFDGGYGTEWLTLAAKRFEELHKDDVLEEGKKGVQIYIDAKKTPFTSLQSSILTGSNDVFFGEWGMYYTLKNAGLLADITDIVTTPLTEYGESRSIEDKLNEQQKGYYGIDEADGKTHYYALPHAQSRFGIVYNVELFDEMGYYFAKTPSGSTLEDRFVSRTNTVRSAGPDGKFGTTDDGLPATYDEFYALCDYINQQSQTPIIFSTGSTYMTWLWTHLWADYEGADAAMNFTFTGTADDLITIDLARQQILKDSGVTEITSANAYELGRSAGKYYALEFMEKVLTGNWLHKNSTNSDFSNRDCQREFINAGKDGKTTEIAMMFEGTWWEEEAASDFLKMEQAGNGGRADRKFGYMPLPKANTEKVAEAAVSDKPYTEYELLYPCRFMKSNVPEFKRATALAFLRFMCTDETLREGTVATDSFFSFDYSLSEEELASMSYWGRSFYEAQQKSATVYPYSGEALYINNQSIFTTSNYCMHSYYNKKTYNGFYQNFIDGNLTAKEFFVGIYEYYKNDNWPKS